MSWLMFIFLMAFVCPMIFRGMGRGQSNRLSQADRERFEALENDLDYRLEDIERLGTRVSELESRLDFTERLLSRRSEDTFTKVETT